MVESKVWKKTGQKKERMKENKYERGQQKIKGIPKSKELWITNRNQINFAKKILLLEKMLQLEEKYMQPSGKICAAVGGIVVAIKERKTFMPVVYFVAAVFFT